MSNSSDDLGGILDVGGAWRELGSPIPTALVNARLELHWAAQVVGSVGHTFAPPVADDSHTALQWGSHAGMLVGARVGDAAGFRAGLALAREALRVVADPGGEVVDEFVLAGHTLDEAYAWMAGRLAESSGGQLSGPLARRDYQMPLHPVAEGATFAGDDLRACAELARWFANSWQVLDALGRARSEASPVRVWPHHFDIATLLSVPGGTADHPRSVGVGMTPGDASYAEPYWYVTPWPYPENPTLPPLAGEGRWHSEGWTGAVLLGTDCVLAGRGAAQATRVAEFLESAIAAAVRLVTT